MTPTFEEVSNYIKTLPLNELVKVENLLQERRKAAKEKANGNTETPTEKDVRVAEQVRKFKLAMNWIHENREKYLGQWVCLDGDKLISHGTDAKKVYAEGRENGIKAPFLERIVEEEKYFLGGFEACP